MFRLFSIIAQQLILLLLSFEILSNNQFLTNRSILIKAADSEVVSTAKTGSWANCTTLESASNLRSGFDLSHPHSDIITISCVNIHYRIPKLTLSTVTSPIVIGVLSAASGDGPSRRRSIRSTWAYRRDDVFFIVAGKWEDIKDEYYNYNDLLWLDKEEIYVTETSILTFKTESFFAIIYKQLMPMDSSSNSRNPNFLFKTDDDSYIDVAKLHEALLEEESTKDSNYWGKCNDGGWKPHRNNVIPWQKKWYISYETYPEPTYPAYCQGAGYALSRQFLDCAIGKKHVERIRYMPNEDVAIGLLAERCNISPQNDDRVWIRWQIEDDEEEDPGVTMSGKIVQHYVKTEEEMRGHHKSCTGVYGPYLYSQ